MIYVAEDERANYHDRALKRRHTGPADINQAFVSVQ
jgi:hypothetical protein